MELRDPEDLLHTDTRRCLAGQERAPSLEGGGTQARRVNHVRACLVLLTSGVSSPGCVVRFGAAGHLGDAAAVGIHDVDLVVADAVANEGDLLSVWRPRVEAVVDLPAAPVRELDETGSVRPHGEDVRGDAGAVADPRAGERDPCAVRRPVDLVGKRPLLPGSDVL